MTPDFFDQVCKGRQGFGRVINDGVPDKERETELQKDAIWHMLPHVQWRSVSILDVCCGIGRLTGWLHSLSKGAAGVDWSPEMLAVARAAHPGLMFMQADVGAFAHFPPVQPPVAKKKLFGLTFQWCAFLHIVDDEKWRIAVGNMMRWSNRFALYCDKVNDNATVDYVRVRSPSEIQDAFEAGGSWSLERQETWRGYEEDEFRLMLFSRSARG